MRGAESAAFNPRCVPRLVFGMTPPVSWFADSMTRNENEDVVVAKTAMDSLGALCGQQKRHKAA